jgi:hypothetical protein
MKYPPYAVSMRIADDERTTFRMWFPVFILWPLLLVFILLTLLATLLVDLFALISGRRAGYTRFLFGVVGVVGETRGTEVFIQDRGNNGRIVAFTVR